MTRFLTADVPPVRGRVRSLPEDFVVEEVLLYEPSGEGTHLWLTIEKTGLTTFEAVRRLARALGRRDSDVGYAGLKDRNAVTRQSFSIEFATEEQVDALEVPGLRVVGVTRHKNKLKLGHLAGNRFRIRIRDAGTDSLDPARAALDVLRRRGVPNRFGPQRFGRAGVTPQLGRALLAEDFESFLRLSVGGADGAGPDELLAESSDRMFERGLRVWSQRGRAEFGVRALPKRFLSLCTSALQSEVFNRVLDRRLDTLDAVDLGDVAYLHGNGACFAVDDVHACAPRAAAFEISPSGPLPGPKCLRPTVVQATLEAEILADLEVRHEGFAARGPWRQSGGRRPLRVPIHEVEIAPDLEVGADLVLQFRLPRGSFATAVLAELFKSEVVT